MLVVPYNSDKLAGLVVFMMSRKFLIETIPLILLIEKQIT